MYAESNDYIIDLSHRNQFVVPYWHLYKTSVKKRWEGKSLREVLYKEWNYLQEMIEPKIMETYCVNKQIRINNKECRLTQILKHDDFISIYCHKHEPPITYNTNINQQQIGSIMSIYETNNVIVILKPSTIPTHPSSLYNKNSIITMLQNGYYTQNVNYNYNYATYNNNKSVWFERLLQKQNKTLKKNNYCLLSNNDIIGINSNTNKFYIVHRLDRLTSGLLIIAKNKNVASYFANEFKNKKIKKQYLALVSGRFDASKYGIVCAKISKSFKSKSIKSKISKDGKDAETKFKLIWYNKNKNISLILCEPLTGRTHQIRVHLSYICKTPIINDPLYNNINTDHQCEFIYDSKLLYHVNNKKNNNQLLQNINNNFKCHICDNNDESINLWWKNLSSTISVSNNGIYLHAFKYTAINGKYQFQTQIPLWACPPDNISTHIFSSIFTAKM
eukprot:371685_1